MGSMNPFKKSSVSGTTEGTTVVKEIKNESNASHAKKSDFVKEFNLDNMGKKVDTCAVVDAVFMCDCTGSMSSYLEGSKEIIKEMIKDIKAKYTKSSIFVGFIAYRDHSDSKILETMDLTSDFEEVDKFIASLGATGGGDEAEAVVDGLNFAVNEIHWREEESLRMLIHVLDAPPHGKEFGSSGDTYPNGCPCKHDYKKLLQELDAKKVQYLVLKCNQSVNKMIQIFQTYHKDSYIIDISSQASQHSQSLPSYSSLSYEPPTTGITHKAEALESATAYKTQVHMQIMSNVSSKFG